MDTRSHFRGVIWACSVSVLGIVMLALALATPTPTRGGSTATEIETAIATHTVTALSSPSPTNTSTYTPTRTPTNTPTGTRTLVDLVPRVTWIDDCRYQGKRITLTTRNLLPDPVTANTTMHSMGRDYLVPPFTGPDSSSYDIYCSGWQCPFNVELTVDYYNEIAETDETNNYVSQRVGSAPSPCIQLTSTSTATPTATIPLSSTNTRTYTATGTPTNTQTGTRTPDTPTPPGVTATTSLTCHGYVTAGESACSDPQTGTYTYTVSLYARCNSCFQSVSVYYTATLMVAPGISGPFIPYAQGPARYLGPSCHINSNVTETITVGVIPSPNTIYKIRIDYQVVWGIHSNGGYTETQPRPICSQPTATPTLTPTSTGPPTNTPTTPVPSSTPTACTLAFSDVPEGSTFYPYVRCLACRGIVSGYADGTFHPENDVTRGQLSKIVANSAEFYEPQAGQTFEDVLPDHTFYVYIERLALHDVIGGYPCGGDGEPCGPPLDRPYFRPSNSTTRGQLAKIVCRAYGCVGVADGQTFEDVPQGSTFYEEIARLHTLGAISGYPCGGPDEPCIEPENRPYFRPGNAVTRGQTAKIVSSVFFPACDPP